MAPIWIEAIGAGAAICTTLAFVPQAVKVIATRETHALSLAMYGIFTLGVFLWLVYGLTLGSWPMIIANIVTLGLAVIILSMKLRYG